MGVGGTVQAQRAAAPRHGRRELLAQGLRLAAGLGGLSLAAASLPGCALPHPPLTVASALVNSPALLGMYNATRPPARVRAVTPPSGLSSGHPPVPAHLPDIVDVTQQNLWLGAHGLPKQAPPFLRALDDLLPAAFPRAALAPEALSALSLDGALYGVPATIAHSEIALSVSLAQSSGFVLPPRGLDLAGLGQSLATASPHLPPGVAGLELTALGVPEWTAIAFGQGGTLTSGGRFTFAEGVAGQALAELGAICRAHGGLNLFTQGRALLSFTFGNGNAAVYAQANNSQIGLLPFLALPRPVSPVLTIGLGISRDCRDPEGAAAFIAWTASAGAQKWLVAHGSPPVRTDMAGDAAWLPKLPQGDPTSPLLHPSRALILPPAFWHPQVMQALGQATVAALTPGLGSTPSLAFRLGQDQANALLATLSLPASPVL